MLLKIFVKRGKHGELIADEFEFNEQFIEGDEISKSDIVKDLKTEGFKFVITKRTNGEFFSFDAYCATKTHGYELYEKGVLVSRYVTANAE